MSDASSMDKHEKDSGMAVAAVSPATTTLKRNIGPLSIVGLGMSICNGWAAMSSTIVVGLSQGGTVTVLYGLIGVAIINVFLALSLGEFASAYPSAGGQYVWSAILAGPRTRRAISFATAWTNIFSWITITASVVIILSEVIFAVVQLYHPDFVIQRWQVYMIYLATNFASVAWNIFAAARTPWVGKAFFYFSTLVFLVITIVVVAKAPTYNDNKFVWATYTNEIGWSSSFVVVMTGLVNPSYLYAGLDGAIHLVEEVKRPEKAVPLALLSTVGMGFVTGMAISVTLIYCVQDLNAALASELPFLEIIVQATGSKACGTVLMVAFLLCLFVSANSVHQSTSRLIWSFARDNGLPFADKLTYVHPHFRVPILPLLLSGLGVTILGALYCASTTAYGSIISTCIILGNISFAIPATQLLLRKREMKRDRWMRLGWLGGVSNVVTILFCLLTTVMWLFPLTPNPKPIDMNYGAAVLGGMALLALIDFLFVRKSFHGPTSDELFAKISNVEEE
ncbi:hypothetical protein NBRC10512_002049 [Rhodotorula toruloides]|uniref:RHTO0S02e07404g1_1 n=2 Tax=Rhodotorula toruloides TaxID=5286 RepID=A0A061AN97_RHOTO|nr:choline transporter [Rhodotorula toruloides NP11]EMS19125.1 choline transporter [Rhodotorula toruloides NP11]KAJ8296419.1 Choline transport protein [Rhodotorula toruloides]CDR36833.1 RHTO0S02e07404g1_1 [Rhodotorula toruloides]